MLVPILMLLSVVEFTVSAAITTAQRSAMVLKIKLLVLKWAMDRLTRCFRARGVQCFATGL